VRDGDREELVFLPVEDVDQVLADVGRERHGAAAVRLLEDDHAPVVVVVVADVLAAPRVEPLVEVQLAAADSKAQLSAPYRGEQSRFQLQYHRQI